MVSQMPEKKYITVIVVLMDGSNVFFLIKIPTSYKSMNGVIKMVSDLRQVSGFFWILSPPPIKLTSTIKLKYC
jgi:hypothetical protein